MIEIEQQDDLQILLVEDNPGDARLIEKRLERAESWLIAAEYTLRHADDLRTGFDVPTDSVDVLLLDLGLPESSGLETLDRALDRFEDVPIIVLTGLDDRTVALEAITEGAQDYLTKDGLTGRELTRAIRYAIERKRNERKVKAERDFFNTVIESLPYPFYVLDVEDYAIEHANSRATIDAGETCYEAVHGRDRPCHEGEDSIPCPLAEVKESGEPTTVEHVHHDDGEERVYKVYATPIVDDDGNVVQMAESNIDITDRVEYERRLEEQRDNLEILNQVVRHDIRNDLQLVQAYAEMLEGSVDEDSREYLEIVAESAENAVALTTTARDLAEVMLRTDVQNRQVSLGGTLERQVDEIQSSRPNAAVVVDGPLPDTDVVGDDMLGAVFRNLLKNAVQHNDKDVPEVAVTAREHDGRVTVRIADNGPGVPDAQKEEIFGKGEKGLESQGTGIGLYLVRELVDSYGGDVWVEDNEPEGSTFVVEIPVASDR